MEITYFIWWFQHKQILKGINVLSTCPRCVPRLPPNVRKDCLRPVRLLKDKQKWTGGTPFFSKHATHLCGKQQTNIHIVLMSKSVEAFGVLWFPPASSSYWDGLEEILKRPFEMDQSWQSGYLVTPSFSLACFTISLNRPFVLPLSKLWSLA